jgi:hypothetical protein
VKRLELAERLGVATGSALAAGFGVVVIWALSRFGLHCSFAGALGTYIVLKAAVDGWRADD